MDCSVPGLPVHHQLMKLLQTHVYQEGDAIQPSQPLSSPSTLAINLLCMRVFYKESVLHIRWPKYWSFSFNISSSNEYSVLISFRTDWFEFPTAQRTLKSLLQCLPLKSINNLDPDNYLVLSTLYSLTLTFIYDYHKIYSTD